MSIQDEIRERLRTIDGVNDLDVDVIYRVRADFLSPEARRHAVDAINEVKKQHPNARIKIETQRYGR